MKFLAAIFLLTSLTACDQKPGGSLSEWMKFQPRAISANSAPSGAWGGRAFIQWTATDGNKFTPESIKKFAASHHFTYVSDLAVSAADLNGWTTSSGDPIFPLGYDGLDATVRDDKVWAYFPRRITQDSVVMKFDTNWIIAIGGVEKPAYAYALLSGDQQNLSLYHLWGE